MIFGYVLAETVLVPHRDIQASRQYQTAWPFSGQGLRTSISPWDRDQSALEPFRNLHPRREVDLLPYLAEPKPIALRQLTYRSSFSRRR